MPPKLRIAVLVLVLGLLSVLVYLFVDSPKARAGRDADGMLDAAAQQPARPEKPRPLQNIRVVVAAPSLTTSELAILAMDNAQFQTVSRLDEALRIESDVLVIISSSLMLSGRVSYDQLRSRNILGIGYGAARVFGGMGLNISDGHCGHGVSGAPELVLEEKMPDEPGMVESPIEMFNPPVIDTNFHNRVVFGIYVGPKKPKLMGVNVIARFTKAPNYAVVSQQDHFILVGVEGKLDRWSEPFGHLVRALIRKLAAPR